MMIDDDNGDDVRCCHFLLKNVSDVILFRSKDTKLVPIYYVLHRLIVSYIFKY